MNGEWQRTDEQELGVLRGVRASQQQAGESTGRSAATAWDQVGLHGHKTAPWRAAPTNQRARMAKIER